jgi:hypothetical protein
MDASKTYVRRCRKALAQRNADMLRLSDERVLLAATISFCSVAGSFRKFTVS